MKTYLRILIYGLCLLIIPIIIVGGIYIADKGTRKVGFIGKDAVYEVNIIQDDTVVSVFDKKFVINKETKDRTSLILSYLDKNIPTLYKGASALVKMIFDLNHRLWVYQEYYEFLCLFF